MSENNSELKNIIEAALLVSGRSLTIDNMLALFPEDSQPSRDEVKAALNELRQDYGDRGIELKQIARGYRFQSHTKYSDWLARLSEERPARYSRASLETIAIIAYRQPVTRGDIEQIRGVSVSTDIIRTLTERDWIKQVGHRDVPGKPALYGTTREFLEYFSLKSLDSLPTLDELRDLEEISKELNFPLQFDNPADDMAANSQEQPESVDSDEEDITEVASSKSDAGNDERQAETALTAAASDNPSN